MRKNSWISLLLAFAIAAFFAGLEQRRGFYFMRPRIYEGETPKQRFGYRLGLLMQRAEWSTLDTRFKWRGNRRPDSRISIIAIDEKSLRELHEWPWPRSIHAQLIRTLAKAPPKALLFDVLFLEPFTANLEGDRELVRASRAAPWVVHSLFLNVQGHEINGGRIPFDALAEVAPHVGSVNAFVDEDGVLRSALPQITLEDQQIPLLSLVGGTLFYADTSSDVLLTVPSDKRGEILVNYVGADHSFPYYSYIDVLNGKVPASTFAGQVVLVGSNATGTYDHYPTPLSSVMPGVEFHANVIDNLLNRNALRYGGLRWTYAAIALFALLVGLVLVHFSAGMGALAAAGLVVVYAGLSQWLFSAHQILIDMAGPLLTLGLGYLAIVVYRFFTEEREKRWVKAAFGQYVSPKVLDVLMADPTKLKMVGERREMTVFFSDLQKRTASPGTRCT